MRRSQFKSAMISFLVTVIVFAVCALFVWRVALPRFSGLPFAQVLNIGTNRIEISFAEQYHLDPDIPVLVFGPNHITDFSDPIVEFVGTSPRIFLPASLIRDRIDPFLFWDEGAGVFFISTYFAMLEFTPGSSTFLLNGNAVPLQTPIRKQDGEVFLPHDLLRELYPWIIEFNGVQNIVSVTDGTSLHTAAVVTSNNSAVRFWGNSRAPVAAFLNEGDELIVFREEQVLHMDEFVRVRTMDGIPGYINLSDIRETLSGYPDLGREPLLGEWIDNRIPAPQQWPAGVRINMVWETAYNQQANLNNMQNPLHPSINVVSPTWFEIDPSGTSLISRVSRDYVAWAQGQGAQVWPKVFDAANSNARNMLMNRNNRRHIINQLIHYVDTLGLDGINIDFEHLLVPEEGPYKIQFLRELSIPMRERGIVLSAAVLVPEPWTMFYRRDLIGLTVDFVQVMTYDEHWSTSPVAGPVASLPWVQRAITNMLNEVPHYRLVMGIPFYVRMWREVVVTGELSRRDVGMSFARSFFEEHDVEWEWLEDFGSYYGEIAIMEDGVTVVWRVWLECERSIGAKMQLFAAHNLAGVAGWARGLETPRVWDRLEPFFR